MFQILVYFLWKNCNLPEKSHFSLSQQLPPPLKNWDPVKPAPPSPF